jgi:SNF2 family DNA or RNA helicase
MAKYRRILTGSPVTKNPLDLYTQCEFLSKECLGFNSFYTFRNRYAILREINLGTHSTKIPVKFINIPELEQRLKLFSFRCTKQDCLDLPPKLHLTREIQMTDEQKKVYEKLKKEARAIIEDEEVSYTNKLTEIIKLHQVTCGFSKTNSGEIIPFKTNPKLEELKNILEETSGKSIIWANYVYNIEQIVKMLEETYGKESVVKIYGAISVEDRRQAVERFQSDDQCKFLVGNPSVGGYGLTLTASRNVIYFSNSYNLEHRDQSEDRAHRIGQTAKVTYIDLLVPKTIDELVVNSLNSKRDLSKEILGDNIKRYFD